MTGIFALLMVLIIALGVFLILIVIAQNPKGGGLSSTFGGSGSAAFGVQRTNDFMEKATWTLAGSIVVLIFLSTVLVAPKRTEIKTDAPAPEVVEQPTTEESASTTVTD